MMKLILSLLLFMWADALSFEKMQKISDALFREEKPERTQSQKGFRPQACTDVCTPVGTRKYVGVGQACEECSGSNYNWCKSMTDDHSYQCNGTCKAFPTWVINDVGQACGTEYVACKSEAFCNYTSKTCTARRDVGGNCEGIHSGIACKSNLWCNTTSDKCASTIAVGNECTESASCEGESICYGWGSAAEKCRLPASLGGSCDPAKNYCGALRECESGNKCTGKALGEDCLGSSDCLSGYCHTNTLKCGEVRKIGESCGGANQVCGGVSYIGITSGFCENNVCKSWYSKAESATAGSEKECRLGLYLVDGKCSTNKVCSSDIYCRGTTGVCNPDNVSNNCRDNNKGKCNDTSRACADQVAAVWSVPVSWTGSYASKSVTDDFTKKFNEFICCVQKETGYFIDAEVNDICAKLRSGAHTITTPLFAMFSMLILSALVLLF
jgi:hypothetical protein